jgi:hypothetical protein
MLAADAIPDLGAFIFSAQAPKYPPLADLRMLEPNRQPLHRLAREIRPPWTRGQRCIMPATGFSAWVRHEVASVIVVAIVRRTPFGRTCRPIGSTLGGRASLVTSRLKALRQCSHRPQTDVQFARTPGVSRGVQCPAQ